MASIEIQSGSSYMKQSCSGTEIVPKVAFLVWTEALSSTVSATLRLTVRYGVNIALVFWHGSEMSQQVSKSKKLSGSFSKNLQFLACFCQWNYQENGSSQLVRTCFGTVFHKIWLHVEEIAVGFLLFCLNQKVYKLFIKRVLVLWHGSEMKQQVSSSGKRTIHLQVD